MSSPIMEAEKAALADFGAFCDREHKARQLCAELSRLERMCVYFTKRVKSGAMANNELIEVYAKLTPAIKRMHDGLKSIAEKGAK